MLGDRYQRQIPAS